MSTAWILEAYDKLWDDARELDPEEKEASDNIEKGDPDKMEAVIKSAIAMINRTVQNPVKWAQYKLDILESEKTRGVDLFNWRPQLAKLPRAPYVGLDVKWEKFGGLSSVDRCRLCFIIELALTNAWSGAEQLPSIQSVV